jgi:predicted DNA-binding transcriptional regulator AlpA
MDSYQHNGEVDMSNEITALDNQLLNIDSVAQLTTLGKSTIRLWVAEEKFPKPLLLGSSKRVWRLKDINEFIESKLA